MSRVWVALGVAGFSVAVLFSARPHSGSARCVPGRTGLEAVSGQRSGMIYFRQNGDEGGLWYMSPDGQLPQRLPEGVSGEPSRKFHNGQRWFLTVAEIAGRKYPNGWQRREVFLVREDGSRVQLTDCPDLEPACLPARWPAHAQDLDISWIARRWSIQEISRSWA
jgi:hypothetical protein